MHSSKESHVEALLDGFQEIHHEMVSDVIAAEREIVFIICPAAFHQFGLKTLFLKNSFLVSVVNRRFAGQADVADLDVFPINHLGGGFFGAAAQKQDAQDHSADEFCK